MNALKPVGGIEAYGADADACQAEQGSDNGQLNAVGDFAVAFERKQQCGGGKCDANAHEGVAGENKRQDVERGQE